jgi:hypothetical protein
VPPVEVAVDELERSFRMLAVESMGRVDRVHHDDDEATARFEDTSRLKDCAGHLVDVHE